MPEVLRSLRFRVTLFATLAVTAALVAAASGLVFAVERTLLGRIERSAVAQMNRVAGAVEAGRDVDVTVPEPYDVVVQVLDEDGAVIRSYPGLPLARAFAPREGGMFPRGPGEVVEASVPDDTLVVRQLEAEELILAQKTVDSPDGPRTIVAISPFSGVARSIDTVVSALWVGTPFLVAFVAIVSWHFAGRTLRPVGAMAARAAAISHSTLGERLPRPGTSDEIDRLAATLNEMLDRLEAAAVRQREFVSDASHELRSPIAAIRAQAEVALVHPEASSLQAVAQEVLEETERMERIVADLLALARAEELGAARRPVDVAALVAEEAARLRHPGIATRLDPVTVEGDEAGLRSAVTNLLENATRHAQQRVAVTVSAGPDDAVVTVEDDGPGVPEGDRERIFERFTRLDEARQRDAGGIGIGLALVRSVASSHGGTVVCSASPLGGARFELRLPRRRAG